MAKLFVALFVACIIACALADDGCGDNASFNECGPSCQPTCKTPKPNTKLCPKLQCTKMTGGCRCNKGYLANSNGSCVTPNQCSH